MPDVGVILGSRSDLPLMEDCRKQLDQLGLSQELTICSAHRNPEGVAGWAMATVATRMPAGVCTIEKRESSLPRRDAGTGSLRSAAARCIWTTWTPDLSAPGPTTSPAGR